MNGVHDMGGMQGFGPIRPEPNEPVFHERWEGRALALMRATGATGKLRGAFRPPIENIPAADYLRMSYYERILTAFAERLVASGLATREEIESGKPAKGTVKAVPPLKPAEAARLPFQPAPARPYPPVDARFQIGQAVRTRQINPAGHTRLPRYARGRNGTVEGDQGIHPFPDTEVYGRGEKLQHVYSVRFAARELWGEQASARDTVYIDLWEDYLEPA